MRKELGLTELLKAILSNSRLSQAATKPWVCFHCSKRFSKMHELAILCLLRSVFTACSQRLGKGGVKLEVFHAHEVIQENPQRKNGKWFGKAMCMWSLVFLALNESVLTLDCSDSCLLSHFQCNTHFTVAHQGEGPRILLAWLHPLSLLTLLFRGFF